MEQEILYLLALKYCPNIGEKIIKKLFSKFGSAKKVWFAERKELLSIYNIGNTTIQSIGDDSFIKKAEEELLNCKNQGISVTHLWDDQYPFLLKECNDAPIFLYYKGNINWKIPSISIVGTRKMTSYGKNFTEDLIEYLSLKNINIISGLALGIMDVLIKKQWN